MRQFMICPPERSKSSAVVCIVFMRPLVSLRMTTLLVKTAVWLLMFTICELPE